RVRCFLATKCPIQHGDAIRQSVEASLRNLRTHYLDVLQFHGGWYPAGDVRRILHGGLQALQRLREEGVVRYIGFTAEGPSAGVSELIATGEFDVLQVRFNLMYGHTCDFVNEAGVMREAEAHGMGIVTMRTLTSGIFQKLLRHLLPEADYRLDVDAFLLNYVLSNPLVDVALVGMRRPEEVARNAAVSDDTASRLDLAALHHRFVKEAAR
ncbi:MAG: aldo/keto reductase, partial [Armatimonadota bacterium]|nr:aldo/keto reductase [Armatimonadota bacterium]